VKKNSKPCTSSPKTYASGGAKLCSENSRRIRGASGGPLRWWKASTSLVRHHRASLWLRSFSEACMEAASLQLRVSLPETSLWRERLRASEPQLDLDGLLCGTAGVAGSGNLCSEPRSSSLQHLSSITYSSLSSGTYSSLGSTCARCLHEMKAVQAASVVLGFLWSGGECAHNDLGMQPCSYSAASRQHPMLRHPRKKRWKIPKQRLFTPAHSHTLIHWPCVHPISARAPAPPLLCPPISARPPAPPPLPPARAQQSSCSPGPSL